MQNNNKDHYSSLSASEKRARSLGHESIPKLLLRLSIPSIVAMTASAFYSFVDSVFIGYLGTSAIGAVAIAFPIFAIVGGFGLLFGIGSSSYIGRLLGAQNKQKAEQVATISVFLSSLISFVFVVLGVLILQPLLLNFGATPSILPYAQIYTRILLFGSFFTIQNMNLNHIVRSEGNAKLSMNAILVGVFSNIILDPIFIFIFGWGIAGAAIATVVAQSITFFILIQYYFSKSSYLALQKKYLTLDYSVIWEIVKIGFPAFIRQFLASFTIAMLNIAASGYGDPAVAAMGITLRVISLGMFPLFGFAQGFQPIASFNYGAGKISRLLHCLKLSYLWTFLFCLCFSIMCILFSEPILVLFSSNPEVLHIGKLAIFAVCVFFPFFGYQVLTAVLFQAIGMGFPATVLSLARQGLFLIPSILILPKFFGLYGVIFSQTLADFLTMFLTIILSFNIIKKLKILTKKA